MAGNFQRGDFCPVAWAPTGGANTVLSIQSHSIDLEVLRLDVTSTGSGGIRTRIAGLLDLKGTVNTFFDLDTPFYGTPPTIISGLLGICSFYLSPTRFIQAPVIIAKVHYESAVDAAVMASFDVEASAKAGLLVYPAVP